MSPSRLLALVGLAGVLIGTPAAPAHAATFSGTAAMGTAGTPFPEGLRLTVVEISESGDMQPTPTFVPINPDGSFSFEGEPNLSYLVGTIHQEVTYSMIARPAELAEKQLKIYQTTRDASVVKIISDSMTVIQSKQEGESNLFEVLQLLTFINASDRTYIGEEGEDRSVLRLPVPEGVNNLLPAQPANPEGLAVTPKGLASTAPLQPGEITIPYLYKVTVPRTGWQLRREVFYPTDHVDLLIGENLEPSIAPDFDFEENKALTGQNYARYRMGSSLPGQVVAADIGFAGGASGNGLWYGLGGIAAAAALAAATTLWRRKRRPVVATALMRRKRRPAAPNEPGRARGELIDQVARLDDSFDAGAMERPEYDAQRARLMTELESLSR